MPTHKEYNAFRDEITSYDVLDNAIDWIKENLSPDEVFDYFTLSEWALDNGFEKEPL